MVPTGAGRTTGSRAATVLEDRVEEAGVPRVWAHNFSVSLDGFVTAAGPTMVDDITHLTFTRREAAFDIISHALPTACRTARSASAK